MRPEIFKDNAPGKVIPLTGVPDLTHAFIPDPLPPRWEPGDLWPLIVEASTELGRLDGIGKHLPNPSLLVTPIQRREAQLSSRLEGTITDPRGQALFELEEVDRSPSAANSAFREVHNYKRALQHAMNSADDPISLRLIRKLHEILMTGVRGAEQAPGNFRRTQNQIDRPARFVPPPPQRLMELLDSYEKYLNLEKRSIQPIADAFLAHYQFETIHPFRDGNGRVGRLLLSILIAKWCGLAKQWLYMSAYFDRHRDEYRDHLLRISTHGEWAEWVRFCITGVMEQARDTQKRCELLLALHTDFHARARNLGASVRLSAIIDGLFESPIVQPRILAGKMGVSYNTADSDLKRLVEAGILRPLETFRPKTFYCPDVYDVSYEGTSE